MKEIIFKKAKKSYIYDLSGKKYFDLSSNANIIGFGDKNQTNYVADHISSKWITGKKTIYHERIKTLYETLFTGDYQLLTKASLKDFFYAFLTCLINNDFSFNIIGERFNIWFDDNIFIQKNNQGALNVKFFDMTELYLLHGKNDEFITETITKDRGINVLNYFWYPEIEIKTFNADIIILPELFSGNFVFLNILINKKSKLYAHKKFFLDETTDIPSLYLSSALKFYHLIKKKEDGFSSIKLNWKNTSRQNRLFTFNTLNKDEINDIYNCCFQKNVLINKNAPYYSYLPIVIEEYQKKFLEGIKL